MTMNSSGPISLAGTTAGVSIEKELGGTGTSQISLNCSTVRTLAGVASGAIVMPTNFYGKSATTVPGAPTIGTATATGSTTATVAFTAPSCTGGLPITGYQAISSPGCITATGSSSPITVSGLTASTSYTFKVRAQNSLGYGAYSGSSNSITTSAASGSQSYTTAGTYSWVAPSGVTKVSIVAVGSGARGGCSAGSCCNCGGSGGGGGGLVYGNNITVVPGNSYTVAVGVCVTCYGGGKTYFCVASKGYAGGGTWQQYGGAPYGGCGITGSIFTVGHKGGAGGSLASCNAGGGGGAAGYGGCGGNGQLGGGQSGTGGAGGGGSNLPTPHRGGGGGGGVGLFGQGSNGAGGTYTLSCAYGKGGSGGGNGSTTSGNSGGAGGNYGGGAGGTGSGVANGTSGGSAALRIVWPGCSRKFPITCVGSP